MIGNIAEKAQQIVSKRSFVAASNFATLALSAYFLADLGAVVVDRYLPEPPQSRSIVSGNSQSFQSWDQEYSVVINRNLFNSAGLIPGEAPPDGGEIDFEHMPAVRTNLPLNLVGTMILRDELRSLATIEDKTDQKTYPVQVNDIIPDKARILKVESKKVTFVNLASNKKEFVDMPEDPSAPKLTFGGGVSAGGNKIKSEGAGRYSIDRSEVDGALSNMSQILTQARAIPVTENGVEAGFRITQIVPGSIYEKLGLKNDDIITAVGGEPINAAKAFQLFSDLKNVNYLELTVKRGGRAMNMSYDVH